MRNITAAFEVFKAQPRRSLLLSLPVAVSIALAMTTLAMDRGVDAKAREAVESWGLDQVVVHGSGRQIAGQITGPSSLTEADLNALRSQLGGVKHVLPTRRNNKTSISFGSKSGVYKLFAVTPPWAEARHFGAAPGKGKFLDENDLDSSATVCVLGHTVVKELFGTQDPQGQEILVNNVPFKVKGILVERGASPAEGDRDARVVIPLSTFASRLDKRLTFDQIVIQVVTVTPENVERIGKQAHDILRQQHHLGDQPDDFEVRVPTSVTAEARGISRSVLYLLLGLAVVTALVAITVVVVVFHQATRARRFEIGLRRAIGARPGDILLQFWAEGLLVSLLGGAVGLGLGLAATWALGQWSGIPVVLLDGYVLAMPLFLVVVTSLAGLIPARSGARLDPAAVLRSTAA
jgi:putative ABC transport system permease protein